MELLKNIFRKMFGRDEINNLKQEVDLLNILFSRMRRWRKYILKSGNQNW